MKDTVSFAEQVERAVMRENRIRPQRRGDKIRVGQELARVGPDRRDRAQPHVSRRSRRTSA